MRAFFDLQSDNGGDCDNTLTLTYQTPINDAATRDLLRVRASIITLTYQDDLNDYTTS